MDIDLQLTEAAILVVDDQPMCVRLLESMLKRAGYIMIHTTTDPRDVAQLYDEFEPDLVILDLHMPHLTGFEVMDQLYDLTGESELPILAVTADLTPPTQIRALRSGARMVLTKPFSQLKLLTQVNLMLRAGLAQRGTYRRKSIRAERTQTERLRADSSLRLVG